MKKIVITGGLGYIGMELCKVYSGESRNCEIKVIDKVFSSSRVNQLRNWGIDFKQVDTLNKELLKQEIKDADLIYHLADITEVGITKGDKNIKRDKAVLEVANKGTNNILKYSKKEAKIVFTSTHTVFEGIKKRILGIDENTTPAPELAYAKGKILSENNIINSGKNYTILRLGTVYGLSQFDSMRVNSVVNLFAKISSLGGTISLFARGIQLKSFVSVVDVARCLKFVGENAQINKEIYHVANESMTIKQLAEICKKNNKALKLINTNDDIPSQGTSLSNKKIKNAGFSFLYNINHAIEEMHTAWMKKDQISGNEVLEIGQDEYIDSRGIISNYYFDNSINLIGYVESKKHTMRGNHYHPIQTQKCLLIKGKYISITKDLRKENASVQTRLVKEGDLSTIPPYVAHTMVFLEDSIFLNLVNGDREHSKYGITHTIPYELVDKNLFEILKSYYKDSCRVCGEDSLVPYLSLGLSPLANNLLEKKNQEYNNYPLELYYCLTCYNSQLSIVVPKEKMFDQYFYLSSTSAVFRNHFENLTKELKKKLKLNKSSVVVDIGSNDGIFLQPLKNLGINAIGVEPAKNVAKIANSKGLTTYAEYFNKNTVKKISKKHGKADLITAFNMFAHNDGLKDLLNEIQNLLKKEGEFIFEVQYFLRTINDLTFDNIYHEHVNYWNLHSILKFFEDTRLRVYKVEEVDTHGGSLRVYTTLNKKKRIHSSINSYLELEQKNKLHKFSRYIKFANDVESIKINSLEKINKIIQENKNIIGYGAPAKATTILNYFGISENHFEYILEDSELKFDKFLPGTNIQIKSKIGIDVNKYDYILVLAWNFFDSIVQNNSNNFSKSKFIKLK